MILPWIRLMIAELISDEIDKVNEDSVKAFRSKLKIQVQRVLGLPK